MNRARKQILSIGLVGGLIAQFALSLTTALSSAVAGEMFGNVADFGFMWWSNGPASSHYALKTSRYGMIFDRQGLRPQALFPIFSPAPAAVVLGESWAESFPAPLAVGFACQVVVGGVTNVVTGTGKSGDVQVVEGGRFFQRRWHKTQTGALPVNPNLSGLEVAAWPDRLSFVLRLAPTNPVANAQLQMTLDLPNAYSNLLTAGVGAALVAADGSGYAAFKSAGSSALTINPTNSSFTISTAITNWPSDQEGSVGLVVYPAATNAARVLADALVSETSPLPLSATRIIPTGAPLTVAYDLDRGWHTIKVPNAGTPGDNGILRANVVLTNAASIPQVARLNFDGRPFGIVGITAVLRDGQANPMGLPVQLSKNWHTSLTNKFAGTWFHGLTMLTVPPNTNLSFELTMAGQNWGGLPAATHSQLSVVGYSDNGNQQWDEAALGNYGEALCYDVEHSLTDNDCTDSRPLMLLNTNGQTGKWTGNYGGGQFLRYYDSTGTQRRHSRMRTHYLRYCPNLTEVTFAGQTDDGKMDLSYSAALFRSDDYTRGVHTMKVNVRSNLAFSRLVFFQQAADTYAYQNGATLAYGDAANLAPLRQWTATFGQNKNIGTPAPLAGPMPWAMTLDSPPDLGVGSTPANRGFVIRSWRARINGVTNVPPYLVERSVASASLFDLVPPPGVSNLLAGDFVEAQIVRFYVPKFASDYYGSNLHFRLALTNYQNRYELGLREAVGQNFSLTPHLGALERSFPIQIRAVNNRAWFTVTGGLGYVPVTFAGLSDYRAPVVEVNRGDGWTVVNQAVNGSDFWQCDYNAELGSWEITFTLPLDGPVYQDVASLMNTPLSRSFRFRLGDPQSPRISAGNFTPAGMLQLSATGEPGFDYRLLSSSNLGVPWSTRPFVTNGVIISNPFGWLIPSTSNTSRNFYRLQTF